MRSDGVRTWLELHFVLAVRGVPVAVGRRAQDEAVERGVGRPVEHGQIGAVGCSAVRHGWTSTPFGSTTDADRRSAVC